MGVITIQDIIGDEKAKELDEAPDFLQGGADSRFFTEPLPQGRIREKLGREQEYSFPMEDLPPRLACFDMEDMTGRDFFDVN